MTPSFHLPFTIYHLPLISHLSFIKQTAASSCKLLIDNSLSIAYPAPKPERSSLQSDYGASSFWCGDNCELIIEHRRCLL